MSTAKTIHPHPVSLINHPSNPSHITTALQTTTLNQFTQPSTAIPNLPTSDRSPISHVAVMGTYIWKASSIRQNVCRQRMAGRRFWRFGRLELSFADARTRTLIRRPPSMWSSSSSSPASTPITMSNVPASAHGSYWWCDVWCLVAIAVIGVTALITSLFINLAYLRHTPYGGPVAPWRDGALESSVGDRFLDGWRLFLIFPFSFVHSFCSTTFSSFIATLILP